MIQKVYYSKKETRTKTTEIKGYFEVEIGYVQLYKNFTEVSHKINSATTFKLLHWLLAERLTDENGLLVNQMFKDFNKYLTSKCGTNCDIAKSTFYNSLNELVDAGAINKLGVSHYYANPALFWTTETIDRIERLKSDIVHGTVQLFNPPILKIENTQE